MKRKENHSPLSRKQKSIRKIIVGVLLLIFVVIVLDYYLPKPGDTERKAERQEAYDEKNELLREEYIEWFPGQNEGLHQAYDRYIERRSMGYEARKTEEFYQIQELLEEAVNQKVPSDKSDLSHGGNAYKEKSEELLDIMNGAIRREVSTNRLDSEITAFFLNVQKAEELINSDLEY